VLDEPQVKAVSRGAGPLDISGARIRQDRGSGPSLFEACIGRSARELALRQWIQRNRNQVSLETWTETRGAVAPINRALINIQLTIVKAELQEILGVYTAISPEYRLETLHKLQKLIPTAQALVDETRDKELGEILTAVAAKATLPGSIP